MDNSFIVKSLDEEESDGKNEDSEHAEKLCAEIHSHKSDNGVNADIHWNKLGLNNLTKNGDYSIHNNKSYAESDIACYKAYEWPGPEDCACAENRENVNNCDSKGDCNDVSAFVDVEKFHNVEPDCNFAEGDEYNGCIGLEHFAENIWKKSFGFYKLYFLLFRKSFFDCVCKIIVVTGEEETCDNADERCG